MSILYMMKIERTKRIFKIGDSVKIRVIEANKMLRKVAFELVED